jgi:hypothetical protein
MEPSIANLRKCPTWSCTFGTKGFLVTNFKDYLNEQSEFLQSGSFMDKVDEEMANDDQDLMIHATDIGIPNDKE